MNKAELKEKWGKYCDTDKLVDDVRELLTTNHHRNSEHGVCALLDKYFTNKEPLIKLFALSNNYAGDMRIVTTQMFDRQVDRNEIRGFFRDCEEKDRFHIEELLQKTDEHGKTMHDYLRTGKKKVTIDTLPKANNNLEALRKFGYDDAALNESVYKRNSFLLYLHQFAQIPYTKVQYNFEDTDYDGAPKVKAGTKTSRAFNKVCQHYGIDKLCPEVVDGKTIYPYNKVFAEYADLVSELQRKMYFVISLNPLDYLQMSYGISWNSCHRINGGQWQGGCLSYMLDTTSIVTFVVNNLEAPIHTIPRFYRQMFHYEDKMLMQNRLYPNANDGATDLYTKFRNFVIEEFSELLQEDGEWTVDKGSGHCANHVASVGAHYRDYTHNDSCTLFYPTKNAKQVKGHIMTVGHNGICVHCGEEYTVNYRLAHDTYCHVR